MENKSEDTVSLDLTDMLRFHLRNLLTLPEDATDRQIYVAINTHVRRSMKATQFIKNLHDDAEVFLENIDDKD